MQNAILDPEIAVLIIDFFRRRKVLPFHLRPVRQVLQALAVVVQPQKIRLREAAFVQVQSVQLHVL